IHISRLEERNPLLPNFMVPAGYTIARLSRRTVGSNVVRILRVIDGRFSSQRKPFYLWDRTLATAVTSDEKKMDSDKSRPDTRYHDCCKVRGATRKQVSKRSPTSKSADHRPCDNAAI